MRLINPATETSEEFPETPLESLPGIFQNAEELFRSWSVESCSERIRQLTPVLAALESQLDPLARAISEDMGKPLPKARLEIQRSIDEFRYLLSIGEAALANEPAPQGFVSYQPLGVAAVIAPWNFPVMLPLRGIVPGLIAGNAVIFKPSELSLRSGKLLAEVFERSLRPCPLLTIYGDKPLGAALVDLPVRIISFTGSSMVGKKIAERCASSLKRVLLELGGLDAALVLADADLAPAARSIVQRNAQNSGQVCNAVKRVYVAREIYEPFLAHAVGTSQSLRIGDPFTEGTEMGPLVSQSQLERVLSFLKDAVEKGAQIAAGGRRLDRPGFFLEHTILTGVPESARVMHEEAFGPLLPVIPVDSVDEAVARANASDYGLMASIWTKDLERAKQIAARLDVGGVSINDHAAGGPGTPWGGAKQSGLGRMKTRETLREFANTKYVRFA